MVKGPPLEGAAGRPRQEREHRLYAAIAGDPRLREAGPFAEPVAMIGDLLVLRRARPGETLDERYRRRGETGGDARLLGLALGAWRGVSSRFAGGDLPHELPWVLQALGPATPELVTQSAGASRLAGLLRTERALRAGLEELAQDWQRDAVIHGDVRWDNAVVDRDPSGRERVLLVDWELLDRGPAGWDVAGAIADAIAQEAEVAGLAPRADEYRPLDLRDLAQLCSAVETWLDSFAGGYAAATPAATEDLAAGLRLVPARVLQIAFLHAAWTYPAGLGSALTAAAIAAALFEQPDALGRRAGAAAHGVLVS